MARAHLIVTLGYSEKQKEKKKAKKGEKVKKKKGIEKEEKRDWTQ